MSNSKLVNYTLLTDKHDSRNGKKIDCLVVHHMAGNLTVENCCSMFKNSERKASATYCIGTDGRIGQSVDEAYRPWTTGNRSIDERSVTIEVANDQIGEPWHVSDVAFARLVDLCADVCRRNGIKKINFTGDKSGNLQMHKWYQATGCPGTYLGSKFPQLASMINARLAEGEDISTGPLYRVRVAANNAQSQIGAYHNLESAKRLADQYENYKVYEGTKLVYTGKKQTQATVEYKVKVSVNSLRIRSGPGTSYVSTKYIKPGIYTIVDEKTAEGHKWGLLKSYKDQRNGWIALEYAERI